MILHQNQNIDLWSTSGCAGDSKYERRKACDNSLGDAKPVPEEQFEQHLKATNLESLFTLREYSRNQEDFDSTCILQSPKDPRAGLVRPRANFCLFGDGQALSNAEISDSQL
jgi:hypothetical protein